MQVTLSEGFRNNIVVRKALVKLNKKYKKNPIRLNDFLVKSDRKVQFTIRCSKSSYIAPARVAPSGIHTRAVSWQAHKEFMRNLFDIDPNARISTTIETYSGKAEFVAKHPDTYTHNVGNEFKPIAIGDLAVKAA